MEKARGGPKEKMIANNMPLRCSSERLERLFL